MAAENDIVLIYLEDTPLIFARIEEIEPDVKKDWYQVKLLMLQIPLQVVSWILRDAYINGEEFTMQGKRMRLERVVRPQNDIEVPRREPMTAKVPKKAGGKVISLADMKK